MASLAECARPEVLGRPCDITKAVRISQRREGYILKLDDLGYLGGATLPDLPAEVVKVSDRGKLATSYLEVVESDVAMARAILFRLIEVSRLDSQLAELARVIPSNGGPLEYYYLRRVCEICPGE